MFVIHVRSAGLLPNGLDLSGSQCRVDQLAQAVADYLPCDFVDHRGDEYGCQYVHDRVSEPCAENADQHGDRGQGISLAVPGIREQKGGILIIGHRFGIAVDLLLRADTGDGYQDAGPVWHRQHFKIGQPEQTVVADDACYGEQNDTENDVAQGLEAPMALGVFLVGFGIGEVGNGINEDIVDQVGERE